MDQGNSEGTKRRGFAALTPEQRATISSLGGKSAHRLGRAHKWDSEGGRKAGRKGGLASGLVKKRRMLAEAIEPADEAS